MRLVALLMAGCAVVPAQISGERIRAHVKFLASDLLEGRGVGQRGGDLATEYLATQLALAGARPAGDDGTFFQRVPLTGVETLPGARLSAAGPGKTLEFRWAEEFVGADRRQKPVAEFEMEAVFAGHGITAPEFAWDDYKGVDVRGKMVVLFTNEPGSDDPKFFAGRALTYYGRWTYKYEEALRQGALGVLIVHTNATAGYGWEVVRNSWAREETYQTRVGDRPELAFAGWVTEEAGRALFGLSGGALEELLAAAETRAFRPIPLGVKVRLSLRSKVRAIESRNIAAMVPGSDPAAAGEAVVVSAHWDHLGVGTAVQGDAIYNGAVDNATGCAIVLEIARAWAGLPRKPRRSALFLLPTAEEGGLRGSEFYASRPLVAPGKTAAVLNYDAIHPAGRPADAVVLGADRTTLWPLVQQAAQRFNLALKPDPRPEQGSFYRSDHFSLARVGVPSVNIKPGTEAMGKPAGHVAALQREYGAKHYHQPSDEYRDEWDFTNLEVFAHFGLVLGTDIANLARLPSWNAGDEFLPAREKSWR